MTIKDSYKYTSLCKIEMGIWQTAKLGQPGNIYNRVLSLQQRISKHMWDKFSTEFNPDETVEQSIFLQWA